MTEAETAGRAPRADALVALSAVCFGASIPISKWALDDAAAAPFALVAARFLIGGLLLVPVIARRPRGADETVAVLACSAPLLGGYLLLTVGLQRTTSTAAAFLSYLLVVFVPVLSAIFLRRLPSRSVAVGIAIALAGLWLLTGGTNGFGAGEAMCLGAAFVFSFHVLFLSRFAAADVDPIRLAGLQLLVVGIAAVPLGAAMDGFALPGRWWIAAVLVAAAGVGGLVLQTLGQRHVAPARASLLLLIDPVVSAMGGYALGERVGWRGAAGAAVILAGIATAELLTGRSRS